MSLDNPTEWATRARYGAFEVTVDYGRYDGFDWQVEKRGKVVSEGNASSKAEAHAEAREAVRGLGGKAEEEA